MGKALLFMFAALLFFVEPVDAQWTCWGQKYGWGCARYRDPYPSRAREDGLYYGYVDNINYPEPYCLPINCQFNYCPPCQYNGYNCQYLENCIQYSNVPIAPRN